VDEPAEWHSANLAANSSHYALLPRLLGGSYVMAVAQRVGVGVHFNPCVPLSCIGRWLPEGGHTHHPGH